MLLWWNDSIIDWSKTYISVVDNTLVWERTFITKKKKTIAVQNISNINTEQSIFERIIGTCKVKIDTNSKSTSDTTDFKIVLKKAKAEEFKKYISLLMREIEVSTIEQASKVNGDSVNDTSDIIMESILKKYEMLEDINEFDYKASMRDMINHGIYSLSVSTVITFLASLVLAFVGIKEAVQNGQFTNGIFTSLASILVASVICFSSIANIFNGFVKYYGFGIKRCDDRIYMQYGLFKKVKYAIPVDKINSVFIKQTLIARFNNKYCVDIVNIGMDDESREEDTCLLIYSDADRLNEIMSKVLPEFAMVSGLEYKQQPKACLIKKFLVTACIMLGCIAVTVIPYSMDKDNSLLIISIVLSVIIVLVSIICNVLSFINDGIMLEDKHIKIVRGKFGRTFQWIEYSKIQYINYNQNILMKLRHYTGATVSILASSKERMKVLPYITDGDARELNKKYLGIR